MFDPVAELGRRQRPGAAMAFIGGIEQAQVALCEGELGHCLGVRRLACECVLASLGGFVGPAARVVHRGQRGARIGVIRVEHQRQATQGLGFTQFASRRGNLGQRAQDRRARVDRSAPGQCLLGVADATDPQQQAALAQRMVGIARFQQPGLCEVQQGLFEQAGAGAAAGQAGVGRRRLRLAIEGGAQVGERFVVVAAGQLHQSEIAVQGCTVRGNGECSSQGRLGVRQAPCASMHDALQVERGRIVRVDAECRAAIGPSRVELFVADGLLTQLQLRFDVHAAGGGLGKAIACDASRRRCQGRMRIRARVLAAIGG